MSNKPEDAETKERVGILRKRDTTRSSASSTAKTSPINRSKPTVAGSKQLAVPKPAEEGGSIFSKRTKILRDKPSTAPIIRSQRNSVSASHSTTTLDSRIAATSQSSLTHKPGYLPSYLRNKPGSAGSKNLVAVQVQCNKKQFNQIKKELSDIQNKAVDFYKKYHDSLVKLSKLNGTDDEPVIEDLKIVNFTENSAEGGGPSGSSTENTNTKLANQIPFNKLKQITDEGVLGQISAQVQSIQVQGLKLLQEFTERLAEINNQMKSTENSESGDTNLFPTKIQNLFDEIEKKIQDEEAQQNSNIIRFITNLKQVMINEEGTPVLMKDEIDGEYENYKKTNELQITELGNKIKELESKKMQEERKNADLTNSIAKEQASLNELKCVLAQFEAKRDEKEKEMERLNLKLKQMELSNKRFEKLVEAKANEITLKDKSIAELKLNVKTIQDKLSKMTNQNQKMENKLTRSEEDAKSQMDNLKTKYQEEARICDQLREELTELEASIANDNKPLRDENERLRCNENVLEKEIYSLNLSLTEMLQSKTLSDKSKTEEQVCRREMVRMEEDLKRMKTNIMQLTEEVNIRDTDIARKTRQISDLEIMVKQLEQRDKVNEYKLQIIQLQDENSQMSKENEQLQHDLTKAVSEVRLQEESLFMQHRLLKIRSELIQSLQESEDTSKTQFSELNAEIQKRSYVVKQLNQEVSSKTEELENLFSTLSAKNLEVKRQDHIIKLLEETHDRNQRVRVKHEEKIGRLENENAELRRFIKYKV